MVLETLSKTKPIDKYQELFLKALNKDIDSLGPPSNLLEAAKYALLNGGKRIRPVIVLSVADQITEAKLAICAALSVEYFHTSSLIADDLPCMDNDDFRRDKPSLHKVFGEATALLASYGLISAAFQKIEENGRSIKASNDKLACCLRLASSCAGFKGATTGQYWDLFPEANHLDHLKKIIALKTETLFEVAFIFGWLFGGGELSAVEKVQQLSHHYGFAFQLADDLKDAKEDAENNCQANFAVLAGESKAKELLQYNVEKYFNILEELGLYSPSLEYIALQLLNLK